MRYSLGLDIGTTSVGWAIINLGKNRIEDLGVRIFEKPENPKDGKSLAEPRRTARSARRRLRRRRQRLNYLKNFFIENKLLTAEQIERILIPHKDAKNPYELREKGLKETLTNDELFIALYHIAKRRGYKSNRKSVEENDKEAGRVLKSISENKQLLAQYETVAVTLNKDSKFVAHKRNKADDYSNSFIRENFLDEIEKLLKAQDWSNEKIDELLNKKNYGLFYQRPFMTPELIEKMRGKCPFEKDQPRAQKASITFEMFRLAQDLAHLTYNNGQKLTEDEINKCIEKCKDTAKITYKAVREVLGYKNSENFKFDYVRGKVKNGEDPEKNIFAELKFYHAVKKTLKSLPEDWETVENDEDLFDEIGYILTANKDDEAVKSRFNELGKLSDEAITELMKLSFAGFGHLSIKALKKITPFILQGNTYDKAVELVGYTFGQKLSGDKNKLPPLNEEEAHQITNPVVKRAISQTIKVVNAVIAKYGAPTRVGVECANELAKDFKERNEIKKSQDENANYNEELSKFIEKGGKDPVTNEMFESLGTNPDKRGIQITKIKFYREQDGKCLYCGKPINLNQLFSDEHYGEIDHIVPFSRCGNDGRGNKVLVHNECNQNKRNQTPYEAWGGDETKWKEFEALISSNPKIEWRKKQRLLAKTPPKEDWNIRALNDTRYITRFMSQFVRKNLKFSDERESGVQKVFTPTGGITSHLRRVWHIGTKDRDENNLHHAADAVIAALVTQGVIQECSEYSKWNELRRKCGSFKEMKLQMELSKITDLETGEIMDEEKYQKLKEDILPWVRFDDELRFRLSQIKDNENLSVWQDKFRDIYKDHGEFINSVQPIFVSRMPKRNGTGQAHKETIRSPKVVDEDQRTTRKRIGDIKKADLEKSVLKESDKVLYRQLWDLLDKNGDDPKKAFSESYVDTDGKTKTRPLRIYKGGKSVDKNGKPISPVSTIKVYSTEPSGFLVNDGKAFVNNGSMIRLDVYRRVSAKKKIEHFFVPVYAHQAKTGSTKILPVPKIDGKITTDIDDSFQKVCSLYPNDYVKCEFCDDSGKVLKAQEGYYASYHSSAGFMNLLPHTSADKKDTSMIAVSARKATTITRYDISVLGDNYKWS